MKRWLKEHREWILAAAAAAILLVLIYFYLWGIGTLIEELNGAVRVVSVPAETTQFNLQGAKKILENRGVLPQ